MQKSNGPTLKAKGFKRPSVEDEAYVKCSLCVVGECLQIRGRRRWNDLLVHSGTHRRSKQGTRNRALITAFYKPNSPGMWTRSAPFTRQQKRPEPSFQAKPPIYQFVCVRLNVRCTLSSVFVSMSLGPPPAFSQSMVYCLDTRRHLLVPSGSYPL